MAYYGPGSQIPNINFADPRYQTPGSQVNPFAYGPPPPSMTPIAPAANRGGPGSDPSKAPTRAEAIGKNTPGGAPGPEDWLAMLKAFADEMNAPLNLEDPLVKNILEGARTQTLASAQGQGVYGGYSQNQAERSYIGAASGLQQQRRQMGQQALQAGVGASQDLAKLRYGEARDKYQDMLANYGRERENAEGFGAALGGGLGGLAGAGLGFLGGGPAGAAAGWKAGSDFGSSFGRGIGGMGQPPPPTFTYRGYGSGGHV